MVDTSMLAKMQALQTEIEKLSQDPQSFTASGMSQGAFVRVELYANGAIKDFEIDPSGMDLSSEQLSLLCKQALTHAKEGLTARRNMLIERAAKKYDIDSEALQNPSKFM